MLKKIAEMLHNREYGNETTSEIEQIAKDNNIVIVFGYSDDNMELRGVINDEIGCYGGGTSLIHKGEILEQCAEDCKCFQLISKESNYIEAMVPTSVYDMFVFTSDLPYESFDILETEGDDISKYCKGIVVKLPSS